MAAAARGAKSAGGTTIGILPGTSRAEANEWIDHVVVTGPRARAERVVAASGDAVIAVGGSYGTLTEIGFARIFGRPGRDPRAGAAGRRRAARRDAGRGGRLRPRVSREVAGASGTSARRRPSTARRPRTRAPSHPRARDGAASPCFARARAPTRGASASTFAPMLVELAARHLDDLDPALLEELDEAHRSNGVKATTRSSSSGETSDMRCSTSPRPRRCGRSNAITSAYGSAARIAAMPALFVR